MNYSMAEKFSQISKSEEKCLSVCSRTEQNEDFDDQIVANYYPYVPFLRLCPRVLQVDQFVPEF